MIKTYTLYIEYIFNDVRFVRSFNNLSRVAVERYKSYYTVNLENVKFEVE
jgi:hypothetical protein